MITKSYVKFRSWIHKKLGQNKEQKKPQRKKDKKKRQNSFDDNNQTSERMNQRETQTVEQSNEILNKGNCKRRRRMHLLDNKLFNLAEDLKATEIKSSNNGLKKSKLCRLKFKDKSQVRI